MSKKTDRIVINSPAFGLKKPSPLTGDWSDLDSLPHEPSESDLFWLQYHELHSKLVLADKVNLEVVDSQTGIRTLYDQVRFSLKNLLFRH